MKWNIKNIILTINILASVSLIGSYVSQFIPPDFWWIPSLLGLAYPYLLLIHLILIFFWLLVKPRYSLISVFVILLGWGMLNRFIQLDGRKRDTADIRLVSYNVKNFAGQGKNSSRELANVIKSFLRQDEPDIICLQEVKLRTNKVFNLEEAKKEFSKIKHYRRIFARFDKMLRNYQAFLHFAGALVWLR